ncbi:MAG: AAA family ATPase [Pirellulales bacterium]
MYQEYWGFTRPAFSTVGDPGWYYLSPTHEEAQARLDFLVHQRRRLGILVGPSGVGKSMTLAHFAHRLRRRPAETVSLSILGMDYGEFLWRLAQKLGASTRHAAHPATAWQAVQDRLTVNHLQHLATVLLLDDADHADHDVLRAIQRLVQCEAGPQSQLTVVLSVSQGRVPLLGSRLLELAELKIELELWDLWQTTAFLQWSLEQAGRRGPVFNAAALQRIHELAEGQPRRVVQLAELALLAGAAQKVERIDDSAVSATAEQLAVAAAGLDNWG